MHIKLLILRETVNKRSFTIFVHSVSPCFSKETPNKLKRRDSVILRNETEDMAAFVAVQLWPLERLFHTFDWVMLSISFPLPRSRLLLCFLDARYLPLRRDAGETSEWGRKAIELP